jgi:hypothetical protein
VSIAPHGANTELRVSARRFGYDYPSTLGLRSTAKAKSSTLAHKNPVLFVDPPPYSPRDRALLSSGDGT